MAGLRDARPYKEIAYDLDLAESTVKARVGSLCRRLALSNGTALRRWLWEHPEAIEAGIVRDPALAGRLRLPKAA
jgi:hypothetical protein